MDDFDAYDSYTNSQFTADISKRMRVPDRLLLAGDGHNTNGFDERPIAKKESNTSDYHRMMTVPDRILVAGGNSHVSSKSTPRELQLENSFLPPTMEEVRVSTPPRSIRLEEHSFPTVDNDEEPNQSPYHGHSYYGDRQVGSGSIMHRSGSIESENGNNISVMARSDSTGAGMGTVPRDNLTPWEELQLVRRQIAKLNHRLMAVELENQQQQQRETILTVIMSAYFIGKFFMWIHRSL